MGEMIRSSPAVEPAKIQSGVVVEKVVSADKKIGDLEAAEASATSTLGDTLALPGSSNRIAFVRARMLRGSVILLLGSALVSGTNLLYNILIARELGAAGFGHATAIYTILMLLSAVTLAFQLVCSKFVAKNAALPAKFAVYNDLLRRSWCMGIALGTLLVFASTVISRYLNLPTSREIALLGLGTAFYIPLGVRRGMLQGLYDFKRLAVNFVSEVLVKFASALLLLHFGWGVRGVIAAVVASIVIAYFAAAPAGKMQAGKQAAIPASFKEGMQAIVFFVGQVIISNFDILLVQHYFPAALAGLYAAVALVGRVVYMLSWSVTSSMFPVSAAITHTQTSRTVLKSALWLVAGMTSLFTVAAWLLTPMSLWTAVLGAKFLGTGHAPFSSLVVSYSAMTSIYSVAVVLLAYEMSQKIADAPWVQLGFSAVLPLGISLFHDSLQQVIMVQLFLMLGLLAAVSVPFWSHIVVSAERRPSQSTSSGVLKLRLVSEDEVISEFLKAEFYQPEFNRYRSKLNSIVFSNNLGNEQENAVRKALLFRRRGSLWRELPANTCWWEVELQTSDVERLRAFPRKQWRKFARGDFYLVRMVENIRSQVESEDRSWFTEKMRSVAADLRVNAVANSVLLIGVDENGPLTIIEGNHRMAAAMLSSPAGVNNKFRYYCGLSPDMTDCCWYQTDLKSLSKYGTHILRYMFHDRDSAVQKALRTGDDHLSAQ